MKRMFILFSVVIISVMSTLGCSSTVDWKAEISKGVSTIISSTVACAATDLSITGVGRCLLDSTWRYILDKVLPEKRPTIGEVRNYVDDFMESYKQGGNSINLTTLRGVMNPGVGQIDVNDFKVKFEEYARAQLRQ